MKNKYNIFKISDQEWWVGTSLNDCLKAAGIKITNKTDPTPLTVEQMVNLEYYNECSNETEHYSFLNEYEKQIKLGGPYPRLFATTEW